MKMRGLLLRSCQSGYDEARAIFNGMFDRRPEPRFTLRCSALTAVVRPRSSSRPNSIRGPCSGLTEPIRIEPTRRSLIQRK
jgi:hypothetical protein